MVYPIQHMSLFCKTKGETIYCNSSFSKIFDFNPDEKDQSQPIMYWTPKIHEDLIRARFIFVYKKVSTKIISKHF